MTKIIKVILNLIIALSLSIFIISAATLIILNFKPLYYTFIKKVEIVNLYSLSFSQIKENYDSLITYFNDFSNRPLIFPHLPSSEGGLIHFKEVKVIFQLIKILAITSLISFTLFALLFRKSLAKKNYLLVSGTLNLCLICLLSLFIFIDFNHIFVLFHNLAFNNDLWLFDYDQDPIILYLPENFFMLSALAIAFLIVLSCIVCILSYKFLNKKHTPS